MLQNSFWIDCGTCWSNRNELERAQQQHEELLLAANEDVESSAKSQLDQLYVLLRDKESELNQRNGSLKKLEDQLNIKHENISQLDSQITDLKAQLTSFQQSTDELKQSKEELVVHREKITTLEQTVETLNNLIAASETEWKIILEERNELKIKDMDVEVSKQTISELRESIDRLNDVVKSKELDIERITNEKDQHQCEFDRLNSQQIANNTEWEQKLDESKHQSAAKEVKIKELIRVLSDKETLIETLQKDANEVSNRKTSSDEETKGILEERDHQIAAKETEIEAMKMINCQQDSSINQLQSEIVHLNNQQITNESEWQQKLDLKIASDEEMKQILEEKNHQIAAKEAEIEALKMNNGDRDNSINQLQCEIEHLNSQQVTNEAEWQQILDETKQQISVKEIDIQELNQSLTSKETLIETLQKDMNGVNDLKTASDEEMKQILEEKNHQIAAKETEIEKINLINTVSENAIKQLQSEIKDLNSHEKDIAEQLKTKDVELDQLSEKLVQVRIDLQEIQTDKERANGINDEQNTQLEQFNVLTEALKQTVAEKDALIAEMERDKAHLQSNVDACTVEKDQLAVECSKLREEVTSQSNPSEKDQLKVTISRLLKKHLNVLVSIIWF